MVLHQTLSKALDNYFSSLSILGYLSPNKTNTIILLDFLVYILEESCIIVSEDDYRDIENVLHNLLGSNCLIPYFDYTKSKSINKVSLESLPLRITEGGLLRNVGNSFREMV